MTARPKRATTALSAPALCASRRSCLDHHCVARNVYFRKSTKFSLNFLSRHTTPNLSHWGSHCERLANHQPPGCSARQDACVCLPLLWTRVNRVSRGPPALLNSYLHRLQNRRSAQAHYQPVRGTTATNQRIHSPRDCHPPEPSRETTRTRVPVEPRRPIRPESPLHLVRKMHPARK